MFEFRECVVLKTSIKHKILQKLFMSEIHTNSFFLINILFKNHKTISCQSISVKLRFSFILMNGRDWGVWQGGSCLVFSGMGRVLYYHGKSLLLFKERMGPLKNSLKSSDEKDGERKFSEFSEHFHHNSTFSNFDWRLFLMTHKFLNFSPLSNHPKIQSLSI